jgi:hypothetical protein
MDLTKTTTSNPTQGQVNRSGGNTAPFSDQLLEKAHRRSGRMTDGITGGEYAWVTVFIYPATACTTYFGPRHPSPLSAPAQHLTRFLSLPVRCKLLLIGCKNSVT